VLNQVYANVLGRPVLMPSKSVVSLGAAIFAFLAAGTFNTVEDSQEHICLPHKQYLPDPSEQADYEELYPLFRRLYFAFGSTGNGAFVGRPPATDSDSTIRNGTKTDNMKSTLLILLGIIAMSVPSQSKVTKQPYGKAADGTPVELYTLQDGKITVRMVEVGLNNKITAEIRSGLKRGEQVVPTYSVRGAVNWRF